MFTKSQQQALSRKFASAITEALDAFPAFLARTDADTAAGIIADIIKTQLRAPAAPFDPQDALDEVLRRIDQSQEERSQ